MRGNTIVTLKDDFSDLSPVGHARLEPTPRKILHAFLGSARGCQCGPHDFFGVFDDARPMPYV